MSWATRLLFTRAPARCVASLLRCPGPLGSCSLVCLLGELCCLSGLLGRLAPVHRCVRWVRCFACAVSWATRLLFNGVPARCVVLPVRRPGPLGFCSPVCPLCALLYVCGVLSHFAPLHRCASRVCCVACALSWATWLLFTGVPSRCVALRVRCPWSLGPVHRRARPLRCLGGACPGPLSSCSPVCPLGVLCCLCSVLGHLAPVHRCARSVLSFAAAVSWATWLLFTDVPALSVVLLLPCPGPLGTCPPVCPLGVLCCVCVVLGHLAPVHRCALYCVCGVLAHLAPVHQCARSVCCVACAVSWATWILFTGVPAGCVALRVRFPRPLGSCSQVRPLGALLCCCGVLGHLAPVHRCARVVCCVASAVSWATWLLFTVVRCVACAVSWPTWLLSTSAPARRVVLCVRCPRPLGSCSPMCVVLRLRCPGPLDSCPPVCPLCVLCCVCGVLGHFAPVHRCARSV